MSDREAIIPNNRKEIEADEKARHEDVQRQLAERREQ